MITGRCQRNGSVWLRSWFGLKSKAALAFWSVRQLFHLPHLSVPSTHTHTHASTHRQDGVLALAEIKLPKT